jgi:hypothetical protein
MDLLVRQLRYTLRTLGRSPAFTATAVLTLALGIGATTAVFSVVHGVLLKPLPFAEPERLVEIGHEAPGRTSAACSAPRTTRPGPPRRSSSPTVSGGGTTVPIRPPSARS